MSYLTFIKQSILHAIIACNKMMKTHFVLSFALFLLFRWLVLIITDVSVIALVLVPTHELCLQVYEILQKMLHRFHWIVPGYIMGGENRSKEKARLRKGRKC